ncbi:hypothetical protein L0Z72_05355 [candidate division KSB1 bacterium]|nr:hypothetical protein [candidate division KSB1 bacterium]
MYPFFILRLAIATLALTLRILNLFKFQFDVIQDVIESSNIVANNVPRTLKVRGTYSTLF